MKQMGYLFVDHSASPVLLDSTTITLPMTLLNGVYVLAWLIPASRTPSNVQWTLQSVNPSSTTAGSFSILW